MITINEKRLAPRENMIVKIAVGEEAQTKQWSGFVSELKKYMRVENLAMRRQLKDIMFQVREGFKKINNKIKSDNKDMDSKIMDL